MQLTTVQNSLRPLSELSFIFFSVPASQVFAMSATTTVLQTDAGEEDHSRNGDPPAGQNEDGKGRQKKTVKASLLLFHVPVCPDLLLSPSRQRSIL
jgi:hypothetical protein